MYCKKCGQQIDDDSKFCWKCGTVVESADSESDAAQRKAQEEWRAHMAQKTGATNPAKARISQNPAQAPTSQQPRVYTNVTVPTPTPMVYHPVQKKKPPVWVTILLVFSILIFLATLPDETKDSQNNADSLDFSVQESNGASQSTEPNSEPTTEPAISEEEYKASCQVIDYKELCRYPDKYIGQKICIKVKLYQIMDTGSFLSKETVWRAYTDNSGYEFYFDDEYYLLDKRPEGAVKVLVDDIVIVYGEYTGTTKVTRALTSTQDELPCIEVKYVDIVE